MEIIYIYIRGGVNRTFSIIDRIYLAVTDKFEGRPSFWQIALRVNTPVQLVVSALQWGSRGAGSSAPEQK